MPHEVSHAKRYRPSQQHSLLDLETYQQMYRRSIEDPEGFWAEQAERFIDFFKPAERVYEGDFSQSDVKWFTGAELNASWNCIDRHLPQRADQVALIWEGDEPSDTLKITYRDLHKAVCRLANALKANGVKKGDRVCIYLPMIPEAAYAMLACARIGAIHSVVFAGFSSDAIRDRILDSECRLVITANEGLRGGRHIPLKANVDKALIQCPDIEKVIVVRRTDTETAWNENKDIWYHEAISGVDDQCPAEPLDAEHPLFILYTSGSTGTPKGVLHTSAGYLLGAAMSHRYIFDCREGEVHWCTADVGWVTGQSYIIYGPLANGATSLMFEGVPTYPDESRYWQIIDDLMVKIFVTASNTLRDFIS